MITSFVAMYEALYWQIDQPDLEMLVRIFCQILEIVMQELLNNQDVQDGCDTFVESGANLQFKCVIK